LTFDAHIVQAFSEDFQELFKHSTAEELTALQQTPNKGAALQKKLHELR
jgi:hypothetical protein